MLGRKTICAVFLSYIAMSGPLAAATLSISGGITCSNPSGIGYNQVRVGDNLSPLSGSVDAVDLGCSGGSEATAGGGIVGGLARALVSEVIPGQSSSASFTVSAEYLLDITTPAGYSGGDVAFSISAYLHAILEASASLNPVSQSLSTAIATLDYSLLVRGNNTNGLTPGVSLKQGQFRTQADSNSFDQTYPLQGTREVNEVITSDLLYLDPLVGARVKFSLTGSGAGTNIYGYAVNALNTFGFDPNGTAINLPDGFSVTSSEANIVNNVWIDPRMGPTDPPAVPLPASALLLLSAVAGISLASRRRTSAHSSVSVSSLAGQH